MEEHTGKIYLITNKDFPKQCYVGSTGQDYLTKRYYRHKQEHKNGSISYGNLFDTPNHDIYTIYAKVDLEGELLRMKERCYYDKYKADGWSVGNQRLPWQSPAEAKIVKRNNYLVKCQKKLSSL